MRYRSMPVFWLRLNTNVRFDRGRPLFLSGRY